MAIVQARVKLPSGPLIPYLEFCKAIAEAVSPIGKNFEGIKCVWAKIYTTDAPPLRVGTGVPYPLDEPDRLELATVLQKLPPLRCPMSEEETALFMKAYLNLPGRPEWEPLFETEEGVRERKDKHNQVMSRLAKAIQEEHMAGRLVLVDVKHLPVQTVQLGAYLTRKDAVAYLDRHGLLYGDEEPAASQKPSSLSSDAGHPTLDADPLSLSAGTSVVGRPKVTDAKRAEAVQRTRELRAEGKKDFMAQVAKDCGVSPRSIHTWVKKDEEMKKKMGSMASYLVGIGKK